MWLQVGLSFDNLSISAASVRPDAKVRAFSRQQGSQNGRHPIGWDLYLMVGSVFLYLTGNNPVFKGIAALIAGNTRRGASVGFPAVGEVWFPDKGSSKGYRGNLCFGQCLFNHFRCTVSADADNRNTDFVGKPGSVF